MVDGVAGRWTRYSWIQLRVVQSNPTMEICIPSKDNKDAMDGVLSLPGDRTLANPLVYYSRHRGRSNAIQFFLAFFQQLLYIVAMFCGVQNTQKPGTAPKYKS